MSSLNKWIGLGRLVADPERRQTPKGVMTTFTMAINVKHNCDSGPGQTTTFVPVVAYGNLAESVFRFVKKSREVLVEGKLRLEPYEDQAQVRHVRPSIEADNIQFLAGRDDETASGLPLPRTRTS